MALSCNPSVVMSSLSGSFWEPGIPCNFVSPWLHPVVEELPTRPELAEVPGRYVELVTLMCGIRRPSLSAFWVEAALSGLVPKVIDLAKVERLLLIQVDFRGHPLHRILWILQALVRILLVMSLGNMQSKEWTLGDSYIFLSQRMMGCTTIVSHFRPGLRWGKQRRRTVPYGCKNIEPARGTLWPILTGRGNYMIVQSCTIGVFGFKIPSFHTQISPNYRR